MQILHSAVGISHAARWRGECRMSSLLGAAPGVPTACEDGREETAPPRVIIADDDPFARRSVRDALQEAGVVVIAEASNGTEAVELGLHYQPDVVLMDVVMAGM